MTTGLRLHLDMSQSPAQDATQVNTPQRKQPGLRIQYMGARAREMNAIKDEFQRDSMTASVVDEFRADLQALSLGTIPMTECQVVWGTGQIRGLYPRLRIVSSFCS